MQGVQLNLIRGSIKPYLRAIAHFFRNGKLAIALLTEEEHAYAALESTSHYYTEIHAYETEES